MRFVRARPRELGAWGTTYVHATVAAMAMQPFVSETLIGGKQLAELQPENGRGWLEAYACLGCGFVEWYCLDPQSVPIGPEYMTDVVDYSTGEPYR
jgi:hypothetical protein